MKLTACLTLTISLAHAAAQNVVMDWNAATLAALKKDAAAPLLVARALAILHIAQRDAIAGEAEPEVAAAAAAYTVAASLLPSHTAAFDKLRPPASPAAACGEAIARRVLESRADDGSAMHVSYVPRTEPGQWRRTPPFFRLPELPQWAGKVRPFVLEKADQFRPSGPPALTSTEWKTALAEVRELGGKDSKTRTAEQSEIAKFWSDFSYTETPPGHWNSIARTLAEKLSLAESARLFATLNIALTDAGIACWDAKYHFNFWRPVTAIPRAAGAGNDATLPDAQWLPLLATPAHPEYPSGHSTFSGAALVVLAKTFGTEKLTFSVQSDALAGVTRKFDSLRVCAEECGTSRVFGGIHYRFSCEDGMKLGEEVAKRVIWGNDSGR